MKARHIQNGHVIDYTNGTEAVIEPGTLVMIGTVAAVAADKITLEKCMNWKKTIQKLHRVHQFITAQRQARLPQHQPAIH